MNGLHKMSSINCMMCETNINENGLVCSGFCSNVAHYKCVGIKKAAFDCIRSSKNLCWFCDNCNDVYKMHVNNISDIKRIVKNLESSLIPLKKVQPEVDYELETDLCQSSAALPKSVLAVPNVSSPECQPASDLAESNGLPVGYPLPNVSSPECQPASDVTESNGLPVGYPLPGINSLTTNQPVTMDLRKKIISAPASMNTPAQQSTSSISKNVMNNYIIGTGSGVTLRAVEPRKQIFVSRLHPDVTEANIRQYLLDNFNLSEVFVHRFTPKLKDNFKQDYSSFKIKISVTMFDKLMDPTSWPAGVLVKEFQNIPKSHPFLGLRQPNPQGF